MTIIQNAYWQTQENKRHNKAGESETHRTNVVHERLGRQTLKETILHNRNTENEAIRHNKVGEVEMNRHNLAGEEVSRRTLSEAVRHNKADEGLRATQLSEAQRHNLQTEAISRNLSSAQAAYARAQASNTHAKTTAQNMANRVQKARLSTDTNLAKHTARLEFAEKVANTAEKGTKAVSNLSDLAGGLVGGISKGVTKLKSARNLKKIIKREAAK